MLHTSDTMIRTQTKNNFIVLNLFYYFIHVYNIIKILQIIGITLGIEFVIKVPLHLVCSAKNLRIFEILQIASIFL